MQGYDARVRSGGGLHTTIRGARGKNVYGKGALGGCGNGRGQEFEGCRGGGEEGGRVGVVV